MTQSESCVTAADVAWPTDRELFGRVRAHLLAMEGPSTEPFGGACRYREVGRDRRCAVGCLVTDAAYDPAMEGVAMSDVTASHGLWLPVGGDDALGAPLARALEASGVPARESTGWMLLGLQCLHDRVSDDMDAADWRAYIADGLAAGRFGDDGAFLGGL
jgi:hypothetical protein